MPQKKPVRSLESLSSLLSETEKEALKLETEKREKQLKKAQEAIVGLAPGLTKKKITDKAFNEMYDFLKQSKEVWSSGTDKEGDYIIHNKFKFSRG